MALPILNNDEPHLPTYLGRMGLCPFLRPSAMLRMSRLCTGATDSSLSRPLPRAFTLIEVLIVVTILAILSAAVIPAFVDSSDDARDSTLKYNLQVLRNQMQLFRAQHKGRWPGFGGVPGEVHFFVYSNAEGAISTTESPAFPFGPYIPSQRVTNPFNGGKSWKISSDPPNETPGSAMGEIGGLAGWFYDPATGRISANAEGSTSDGTERVKL